MRAFTRSIASLLLAFAVACPVAVTYNSPAAQPAVKKRTPPAKAGPPPRAPFSAKDEEAAVIPGIPDARFWADSERGLRQGAAAAKRPLACVVGRRVGRRLWGRTAQRVDRVSGKRPEFAVVTGVSTGALMASYAFLGSRYDDQLRDAFSSNPAADVFEAGATPESLLDTWPLREVIGKRVTREAARGHRCANMRAGAAFSC